MGINLEDYHCGGIGHCGCIGSYGVQGDVVVAVFTDTPWRVPTFLTTTDD